MTDEQALLRAICEHPDDDTPRLVFADWLDEHGGEVEAAWAAHIRHAVRPQPGVEPPRHRGRSLDSRYWVDLWLDRLGVGPLGRCRWDDWRRGFPESVTGEFDAVREERPRFADRVPFRDLSVTRATDADLAELATWPELRRLRRLAIHPPFDDPPLGDAGLLALTGCPSLSRLVELRLSGFAITDAAAESLLDSPHLARVRSLSLRTAHQLGQGLSERVRMRFLGQFGVTVF